jgi:hypothetical protein
VRLPVSRPAVGANALTVALAVAVGLLLTGATGTRTAFAVGVAGVVTVVLGLRVIRPEVTARLVVGDALVLVGTVVAIASVGLALRGALVAQAGASVVPATAAVAPAVFGVGAVLYAVVDGVGRADLREAAFLYGYLWIVLLGTLAALLTINVGLLTVGADLAGEPVAAAVGTVVSALDRNGVTRLGVAIVLVGVVYGLWRLLARARLYRRLGTAVCDRVVAARRRFGSRAADEDPEPAVGPHEGKGDGEGEDGDRSGWRDSLPGRRTRLVTGLVAVPALGVVTFGVGLGIPPDHDVATVASATGPVGDALGWVAEGPPFEALVLAVPALVAARAVHAVAARVVRFPWETYRRRVGRATVPVAVVAATFAGSRPVLSVVRDTPQLHYVPSVRGTALYLTSAGVQERPIPGSEWTGLERSSEAFLVALDGIAGLAGPTAVVLVPVGLAAVVATLAVAVPYVGGWLLVPRVGTPATVGGAFLFAAAAMTATVPVPTMTVLLATAGVLGVWPLSRTAADLGEHLGEYATTGRAEAVHAVGAVAAAGACLAVALALDRVAGVVRGTLVARPAAEGLGAVVALLAVAAAMVGLVALRRAG